MKSFAQLVKAGVNTTKICDMVIDDGKVLRDLKLSTLTLIYMKKADPVRCGSYQLIGSKV